MLVTDLLDQWLQHRRQHHEDHDRDHERGAVERHVVEHGGSDDQADRCSEQRNADADEKSNHEALPRRQRLCRPIMAHPSRSDVHGRPCSELLRIGFRRDAHGDD